MLELGLLDYFQQFLYPSIKVTLFSFQFQFRLRRLIKSLLDESLPLTSSPPGLDPCSEPF